MADSRQDKSGSMPPTIQSRFTELLGQCNDPNAKAIIQALEIVAMELRDLNVVGSAMMSVPEELQAISSALSNDDPE